jgi:uncharacterized protein (DUF1499 family)
MSRIASTARIVGVVALVCFVSGPVLIQLHVLGPGDGWRIFMLSWPLALLATLLGAVGLWLTRPAAGRAGRERAGVGTICGVTILAVLAVSGAGAFALPVINDITTDPADPPVFVAAQSLADNAGRDMSYPGDSFAAQQRVAYPDLVPIRLDVSRDEALTRVEAAADELGWETTYIDRATGVIELTKTSSIFRFVDDIAVRVRPSGSGSVVDVRSKSRLGKGDLGANAAHIRALRSKLAL